MDATLVVLKDQKNYVTSGCGTKFNANIHYRCCQLEDQFLVYGVNFDKETFEALFEPLHERIMNDMSNIGLLPMMKPLSKKAFTEIANDSHHKYGKGKKALHVFFFGNKMDGLIGFYPSFSGDSKAICLKEAYENYKNILNGCIDAIDEDIVQRGNGGVPSCYADLYYKGNLYNPQPPEIIITN